MKMAIQKGHIHVVPRVRTRDLESTQSQNSKYIAMQI